ncbi:hypothetical protein DCS_08270 [Drechmeria coniospora]|uniref:Uncharacterized protein n=1 Tax=Drechmeria coniospora TaxID=98403 RepID=A0A151GGR7_DRECN|nr:hypothetical protein DCS_08270 [Drechmeria coniospora]KYK56300.1 hypothetical protein DCS_08270 [Drechmeria coniospora]
MAMPRPLRVDAEAASGAKAVSGAEAASGAKAASGAQPLRRGEPLCPTASATTPQRALPKRAWHALSPPYSRRRRFRCGPLIASSSSQPHAPCSFHQSLDGNASRWTSASEPSVSPRTTSPATGVTAVEKATGEGYDGWWRAPRQRPTGSAHATSISCRSVQARGTTCLTVSEARAECPFVVECCLHPAQVPLAGPVFSTSTPASRRCVGDMLGALPCRALLRSLRVPGPLYVCCISSRKPSRTSVRRVYSLARRCDEVAHGSIQAGPAHGSRIDWPAFSPRRS